MQERLSREGVFTFAYSVALFVPSAGRRERFEWRNSSSPAVRNLEGRRKGSKFVRVSTGEVLAVYAGAGGWSLKKVGKVRWLGGERGVEYGEGIEVVCLMSLVALLERARRSRNSGNGAAGSGVAASAAAAGAAAGGGC